MNKESFTYWLNGWVELNGGDIPTEAQWKMIVDHLKLVFTKVTPPLDNNFIVNLKNNLGGVPLNDLSKAPSVFPPFQIYQPQQVVESPFPKNPVFC